jgi:hypothetical protein
VAKDKSRTARTARQQPMSRPSSRENQTLLYGESSILELISKGAPLPEILNKLCAAIDTQIGNAVSVISPEDDYEHDLRTITYKARRFDLHVFWLDSIALRGESVLGWLEMYSCIARAPTRCELRLIKRVTHLAGLAIQQHNQEVDPERFLANWTITARRDQQVYVN